MKQVFFHYQDLEEHRAGMWRIVGPSDRDFYVQASARLMADPDRFRDAMLRAVREWPNSMRAAMTTPSLNRRAYMGHAGCCIAEHSPEDLTRLGWHTLTQEQQDLANLAADDAIAAWEATQSEAPRSTGGLWDA